jgi:hypothetical protein
MNPINQTRRWGVATRRAIGNALRWTGRRLKRLWQAHRRLIDSNAAYATAMATAAASLIRQVSLERFLVAFISACLAIYVAIRGRILASGQRFGGFGADQDDWDDEDERPGVRLFRTPRWSDR